jgi:hypothetical protein
MIITRGFGKYSLIVTRGYGLSSKAIPAYIFKRGLINQIFTRVRLK